MGRIQTICFFRLIRPDRILQIADLHLRRIAENIEERHKIVLCYSTKAVAYLVKKAKPEVSGARNILQCIRTRVPKALSEAFLADKIQEGITVQIQKKLPGLVAVPVKKRSEGKRKEDTPVEVLRLQIPGQLTKEHEGTFIMRTKPRLFDSSFTRGYVLLNKVEEDGSLQVIPNPVTERNTTSHSLRADWNDGHWTHVPPSVHARAFFANLNGFVQRPRAFLRDVHQLFDGIEEGEQVGLESEDPVTELRKLVFEKTYKKLSGKSDEIEAALEKVCAALPKFVLEKTLSMASAESEKDPTPCVHRSLRYAFLLDPSQSTKKRKIDSVQDRD